MTPQMLADLQTFAPVLVLWGCGSLILVGDALVWRTRAKILNAILAGVGIFGAFFVTFVQSMTTPRATAFAESVVCDMLSAACTLPAAVTGIFAVLLASTYLRNRGIERGEYYALLVFAVSGILVMATANDLVVMFLGLELLSFCLYVLAGFARTEARSEEASIKYFLLGAFASAFLLYGIALLYGALQTTNLDLIWGRLVTGGGRGGLLVSGLALVLIGLAFKVAAVPFHQWTPDVYQGAPTSSTAFMASAAKVAGFAALLRLLHVFSAAPESWMPILRAIAIATMVVGNVVAVAQTNIKRMLAFSGIAHAGYLLVAPVVVGYRLTGIPTARVDNLAMSATTFYLLAYALGAMGAFGVLIYLSRADRDVQELDDIRGLAKRDPALTYALVVLMLTLAGVPPTAGFVAKWQVFGSAIRAGELGLAISMAVTSAIGAFYYLRVVWYAAFDPPTTGEQAPAVARTGARVVVTIAVIGSLLLGILPSAVTGLLDVVQ